MAKHTKTLTPAEVFPPGEFIREELEARGCTQGDLAEILGRPLQTVNRIVNGRKRITPETAVELAQAFGTSPELWLNLDLTPIRRRPRGGRWGRVGAPPVGGMRCGAASGSTRCKSY